jgi:hypothetical protein
MFRRHTVDIINPTALPSNIQQSKHLTNEVREFIQSSFRDSPDFQWMTGYHNGTNTNNTDNDDLEQIHITVTNYMMTLIVSFTERYGKNVQNDFLFSFILFTNTLSH